MRSKKQLAAGILSVVLASSMPGPVLVYGNVAGSEAQPAADGTGAAAGVSAEAVDGTGAADTETAVQQEADVVIRTVQDLEEFARACSQEAYSRGKVVSLEADLDLAGAPFDPIPVFAGTFRGNGHRISGMKVEKSGSHMGFFRFVEAGAVVEDLHVEGSLRPDGSRKQVGGIAGTNRGTILRCSFSGEGEALEALGGIAGKNEAGAEIRDCRSDAILSGNQRIGGIAGENEGTITGCSNAGSINVTMQVLEENAGSLNFSIDEERMRQSVREEKINDVGGIAGLSSGVIRDCENSGPVGYSHTGYNVGGIAGRQSGILSGCKNTGMIAGRKDVGGIAGQLEPYLTISYQDATIDQLSDQLDRLSDTGDTMTDNIRSTSDDATANMDQVDAVLKEIKEITRAKKDERRAKRETFDEQAGRQLDVLDEIVENMEFDIGSRSAQRAAAHFRGDLKHMKEILALLSGKGQEADSDQAEGGYDPDAPILDEDAGSLQYLYQLLMELQESAQSMGMNAQTMITDGIEGVVDGVRDLEDDLDSIRVEADILGDLARDYKDQLFDDLDGLDADLTPRLDRLYDEIDLLSDNLKSGKSRLRGDVDQIDEQMQEMQDIVKAGRDRAKAERDRVTDDEEDLFEDVSQPEEELKNGLVAMSENQGSVEADYQAGGIVGIIGLEIGMDPEEDIDSYGDKSLNMTRHVQAVVRGCRNDGDITVKNDQAGGIVGTARLGAVAGNQNYGDVQAEDGDYAGGIAGSSKSTIQNNYSMCQVTGNQYVGGITGRGKHIRDNYAMTEVSSDGGEWLGSIAGDREDNGVIAGNFYVDEGLGAVDGISYEGEAKALAYGELVRMEGVPAEFQTLKLTFLADGQVVKQLTCDYGKEVEEAALPAVPQKEGFHGAWEPVDLSRVTYSRKIQAVYRPWTTTIASDGEAKPVLLAEGEFYANARLRLEDGAGQPWLEEVRMPAGYKRIGGYSYEITDPDQQALPETFRLHLLVGKHLRSCQVALVENGEARLVDAKHDGEYRVFDGASGGQLVIVEKQLPLVWLLLAVCAAAGGALLLGKNYIKSGPASRKQNSKEEADKDSRQPETPEQGH